MKYLSQLLAAFFLAHVPGMCFPVATSNNIVNQARSAQDCADPTVTQEFVVAFSPSHSWHHYNPRWNYIDDASTNGVDWKIQGPAFLAWMTPQDFTVPLWELSDPTVEDLIFLPANSDGGAPDVANFIPVGIVGYVYDTQVCGSVPLLSASRASVGDHYYTTSATEHSALLERGWADAGISCYVLPLTS